MRFSKKIKFFSEAVNIPLDKEMIGTCYVSIGQDENWKGYMVLSLGPLPIWCEYAAGDTPMPVVDCPTAAIIELTEIKTDRLYEAIKYDEFIKILVTANVEDISPDNIFNIYHDILAYRHAYIARETTDITRAVDKYNAHKFLNEYRNLIINTNGYGTTQEEKAPYLRFIDGEKGAFSVLREL